MLQHAANLEDLLNELQQAAARGKHQEVHFPKEIDSLSLSHSLILSK
jgi:type II secretory pathway predicted ATPase ExeA